MKKLLVLFLTLTPIHSFAQQSPTEQALGNKLLQEIQTGITCSANLISTKAELIKAQERIKELENKEKK